MKLSNIYDRGFLLLAADYFCKKNSIIDIFRDLNTQRKTYTKDLSTIFKHLNL